MSDIERPSTEPVDAPDGPHEWFKVLDVDELPEGRVTTVTVGRRTLAITHVDGAYGALSNHCPHQGGPTVVLADVRRARYAVINDVTQAVRHTSRRVVRA